jgi:hypothetical protein
MKLPAPVVILQDKLLRYLLISREESDKSEFLASAGYTLANHALLERDLRQLVESHEVSSIETSPYGIKYEVRGALNGPNGRVLSIVSIWITLGASGETRFVTLFPDKEAHR